MYDAKKADQFDRLLSSYLRQFTLLFSTFLGWSKLSFFMALMALNWAFIFEIMARDAYLVCNIFPPAFNDSNLGLVAVVAVIMYISLVPPMLEPEFHVPHLYIDNLTARIFGFIFLFCCKDYGAGEDKAEGESYDHG
jgi:hypothetical protein